MKGQEMKRIPQLFLIAAAGLVLAAVGGAGVLHAQTAAEVAPQGRPALAVPIKVTGAEVRQVPASILRRLEVDEAVGMVEVLDLGVEVSTRALEALPPSLEPMLHVGGAAFPVQRVEHSNWDARNEQPIDPELPIGETQTYYFFIPGWQQLESGQVMFLSVMTAPEIQEATGGQLSVEVINRVLPELEEGVLRYVPREFINLER